MQLERKEIGIENIFFAAISGLLLTGAFPRLGMHWLAWFALVPLLFSIINLSPRNSFLVGFFAGFVHNMTLLYWLSYTMNTYGHLPWPLCIAILVLFCAYLSSYLGVFSVVVTRLCAKPSVCFLTVPFLWVALEYVRSFLFSGFPWELIGYSQFENLRLIQISEIFGVYGVSFLIVLVNGSILLIILYIKGLYWQGARIPKYLAFGSILTSAVLLCLTWITGGLSLKSTDELMRNSLSVPVTVVQGNIEQSEKWDPAFQLDTIQKYLHLSLLAKPDKSSLMVWPETAMPFYLLFNIELTEMVKEGIRATGTDFLIGSPSYKRKGKELEYYNSAYLFSPKGRIYGKYDKVHLVPFGEYVPFKKWFPFFGKMVAQVGDFVSGRKGNTIPWKPSNLGVQICYEIIFPDLSREMVKNGAGLLVNITNDAWYGRSSAPYQHFSMAVFRAIENRRSLIRSANTGISGFVDPAGRIIGSTPLFQEAVLTQRVPVFQKTTFYTRFGDVFALICLVVTILVAIRQAVKEFKETH